MKLKTLSVYLILFCFILSSTMVLSFEPDLINGEDFVGHILPGPIKTLFNNEQINIHLTDDENGEITILGFVTDAGRVTEFIDSGTTNPTISIYTSATTIYQIEGSDKPLKELRTALNKEEIEYEVKGFVKNIKFKVSLGFLKIAGGFS